MPIYEYACPKCNTKFERLLRSSNDGRSVVCPRCGAKNARKVMSPFAVGAAAPPAAPACGRGSPCSESCGDGSCVFDQ